MQRIIGAILFVVGLLFVVGFPNISGSGQSYQPESFSWAGILIGLSLIGLGIYLMKT